MKRLVIIVLAVGLVIAGLTKRGSDAASFNGAANFVVGGTSGCSTSISDDFSSDLSKWTELGTSGQWNITTGELKGLSKSVILYTNEQTCDADQWVMAKWRISASGYAGVYLRSQNDETTYAYAVRYEEPAGQFVWRYCGGASLNNNQAENCQTIASWANTLTDDDYVGVEITGTGTSTVVKIYDLGTTAKNHANWASSSDASTTLTTDPVQEANVGKYVGAYNGSNPDLFMDDYQADSP